MSTIGRGSAAAVTYFTQECINIPVDLRGFVRDYTAGAFSALSDGDRISRTGLHKVPRSSGNSTDPIGLAGINLPSRIEGSDAFSSEWQSENDFDLIANWRPDDYYDLNKIFSKAADHIADSLMPQLAERNWRLSFDAKLISRGEFLIPSLVRKILDQAGKDFIAPCEMSLPAEWIGPLEGRKTLASAVFEFILDRGLVQIDRAVSRRLIKCEFLSALQCE